MKTSSKLTFLCILALAAFLSSCTCNQAYKVEPIRPEDKKLTCRDVVLEINETEQYRKKAGETKVMGGGQMLLPLCWIPSYMNAHDAMAAADDRLEYLGEIYDVLGCSNSAKAPSPALPPPPSFRPGTLPTMRRPPLPPMERPNYSPMSPR